MKTITFDETRWKLVPVESTPEMEWSWNRADVTFTDGTGRRLPHDPHSAWKSRYAAMLAATPAAPELQALIVAHTTQSQESAAPQGEPLGYINAGHLHEIQSGRVPYVYVYAGPSVGAEVPVYTTPSQEPVTLTVEQSEEIESLRTQVGILKAAVESRGKTIEQMKAAAAVPQGWKLVPVEPTPDMEGAGRVNMDYGSCTARQVWSAMLAATPATPSQPMTLTLTDERLREIDDAHNWQTTEGRMAAYKTIIADLKANVIKARSKE